MCNAMRCDEEDKREGGMTTLAECGGRGWWCVWRIDLTLAPA